jgi:hypothetical protein
MKKNKKLIIAFGILIALIIGFIVGMSVEYPKIDLSYASGTIGKIKNYRNVKASEADIMLVNDLVADTNKTNMLKAYYNFYYVNAAYLSVNISNAIKEANIVTAFESQHKKTIEQMADYADFLAGARTDILMQISALNSITSTDPALFMVIKNQANNVIVQMSYRNKTIIDFLDQVDTFVKENPSEACTGLKKAHDILSLNQVYNSIITKDKITLKYFEKKPLFSNAEELKANDQVQLNNTMQQDFEKLNAGFTDTEKLGTGFTDKENLNAIFASANTLALSLLFDFQKLGGIGTFDSEKLGYFVFNSAENLGIIVFSDSEKLGVHN